MASVYKKGRDKGRRGSCWYIDYCDENGRRRTKKGCPDKAATEAIARKLESDAELRRRGVIDPRADGYARHEARPLSEHLDDWHADLIARGSTRKHADLSRNRAGRLIDLGRVQRISELSQSRIQGALKALRDDGLSLRSIHHYTRAAKGFSRWLWRDRRAREDSLAHLTSPNPDTDRRHERRALSPAELVRIVQAAECGPVVYKLGGQDRAMLYRLAMGTGFRANELRSLTPESFHLDGEPPTVMVSAGYSKRRRDDTQPIPPALAAALRPWLASKAPGSPVFGELTKHTADMLRVDLEAVGIAYRDSSGRVADFHALRHSYVTALAMSNAPVKIVQSLARHSTPTLTLGTYAHVGLFDQSAALDALPDLTGEPSRTEAAALAPTGTDGHKADLRPVSDPSVPAVRTVAEPAARSRDRPAGRLRIARPGGSAETPRSAGDCGPSRPLAVPVSSGGGGIRTLGTLAGTTVFKTVPINHSGTPPTSS